MRISLRRKYLRISVTQASLPIHGCRKVRDHVETAHRLPIRSLNTFELKLHAVWTAKFEVIKFLAIVESAVLMAGAI